MHIFKPRCRTRFVFRTNAHLKQYYCYLVKVNIAATMYVSTCCSPRNVVLLTSYFPSVLIVSWARNLSRSSYYILNTRVDVLSFNRDKLLICNVYCMLTVKLCADVEVYFQSNIDITVNGRSCIMVNRCDMKVKFQVH